MTSCAMRNSSPPEPLLNSKSFRFLIRKSLFGSSLENVISLELIKNPSVISSPQYGHFIAFHLHDFNVSHSRLLQIPIREIFESLFILPSEYHILILSAILFLHILSNPPVGFRLTFHSVVL